MQAGPRSVLLTGASRGLGLEFIRQLLALPTPPKHIIATCRCPEKATELQELAKNNASLTVLKFDVTQLDTLPELVRPVEEIVGEEGLNLLINNAGINPRSYLDAITEKLMMDVFKTNTVAPLFITKALLPLLKKAAASSSEKGFSYRRAMVASISSKLGSIEETRSETLYHGGHYDYRTSKTALNMVMRCLSIDLSKEGILVMPVHPGWVRTDMGGPRGEVSVPESISGMLKLISIASDEHMGMMYDHNCERIPW